MISPAHFPIPHTISSYISYSTCFQRILIGKMSETTVFIMGDLDLSCKLHGVDCTTVASCIGITCSTEKESKKPEMKGNNDDEEE